MRGKKKMDPIIAARVNDDERAQFDQFWTTQGFSSGSELIRLATFGYMSNCGANQRQQGISDRTLSEANVHLNRTASVLQGLLAKTANDNWQPGEDFETALKAALRDLNTIKQKLA